MSRLLVGQRVDHRFTEFDVFVRRDRTQGVHAERVPDGLAAPLHFHIDLPPDMAVENVLEREELGDRFAVDGHENIAGPQQPIGP